MGLGDGVAVPVEWSSPGPWTPCYLFGTVLFKGSSTEQISNTKLEKKQSFYVELGISFQDR